MNVAASERLRKERSPEKFCANPRCLWRASSGPCPKHQELARIRFDDAVQEAREIIAEMGERD